MKSAPLGYSSGVEKIVTACPNTTKDTPWVSNLSELDREITPKYTVNVLSRWYERVYEFAQIFISKIDKLHKERGQFRKDYSTQ